MALAGNRLMAAGMPNRSIADGQRSTDPPPLLQVSDLRVEFRSTQGVANAVNGVSYTLQERETLAILGESGSGKSVSAEAVMGIVESPPGRITHGSIRYRGIDLLGLPQSERRAMNGKHIAMIFQDPQAALDPAMSVGSQIAELFQVHRGVSRQQAMAEAIRLMDRVQIPAARERAGNYPHQFSGGMCQRVMIALAVALGPDILIADEPTTALDVTIQAQIMRLLAEIQRETGMGLILITHDIGVVRDVADNVVVMYAGRVAEAGPIAEVFSHPAHPYTVGLMRSVPRLAQKGARLIPIAGTPPSPLRIPPGCPFHPRCHVARERCATDEPPLRAVSPVRQSACHYAAELLSE